MSRDLKATRIRTVRKLIRKMTDAGMRRADQISLIERECEVSYSAARTWFTGDCAPKNPAWRKVQELAERPVDDFKKYHIPDEPDPPLPLYDPKPTAVESLVVTLIEERIARATPDEAARWIRSLADRVAGPPAGG